MTESVSSRLPTPSAPGRYRVALVCLGNICRSPMAQVVLEAAVADEGLQDSVEVMSAGTADYHVGRPMDRRAAATLTAAGYDASRHRAQQLPTEWLHDCDLVLAMDRDNLAEILEAADGADALPSGRVRLFRELDPRAGDEGPTQSAPDVPDPYYGGDDGFEHVLAIVTRTSRSLASELRTLLAT